MASRIQGVAKQLQRNMTMDRVSHLLERREDPEQLQAQGILHGMHDVRDV